jgi:aubergine-like protein
VPGKYFSTIDHHEDGQDISRHFSTNVIAAVNDHIRAFKVPPQRIIIYRDGVGDGDINSVLEHEANATEDKLKAIYKIHDMQLQYAFIIINKRINTRIFIKSDRNGFENPLPGTVIDDVITLPERYDFYLISQSVSQGTVAPTSYNVIKDTLEMNPGVIQMLTYRL